MKKVLFSTSLVTRDFFVILHKNIETQIWTNYQVDGIHCIVLYSIIE